jgi:SSS family solute:Na+ symporter
MLMPVIVYFLAICTHCTVHPQEEMLGADGMIQPDKAYPVLLNLPTGLKGLPLRHHTAVLSLAENNSISTIFTLIFSNNTSEKIKPKFIG